MRWHQIVFVAVIESLALRAAVLEGVVKDPTGYPVDRAVVWAVAEKCLESQHTISDKQGQYSFPNLPPGTYRVFATHMGFWQGEKTLHVENERSTKVDLEFKVSDTDTGGSPPSAPLSGTISDTTGHPISGAHIYYSNLDASSGSDGRFGFCRVRGAQVELRIEHQDYLPRTIKVRPGADRAYSRDLKIVLRER